MLTLDEIKKEVEALKARGIKKQDVARTAGITAEYLSMMINGKVKRPSGETLAKMEKAFSKLKKTPEGGEDAQDATGAAA